MSRVDEYKATVVSVVPFPIHEFKPGIYPGDFTIEAAKDGGIQLLVVGESQFYVEVDENRSIVVKSSPNEVARSIVEDYLVSNLAYSEEDGAVPGIFWVPGNYDNNGVIAKFGKELKEARDKQWKWFIKLVQMADDDWEKTRQHRAISDMQRYACKALGYDRPWIIEVKESFEQMRSRELQTMIKCGACRTMIDKDAIVCPSCKLILNPEKYKNLQFAV